MTRSHFFVLQIYLYSTRVAYVHSTVYVNTELSATKYDLTEL
jgi:hypothetical protein